MAFQSSLNTVALTVGTASTRAALVLPALVTGWQNSVQITNSGTQTVFVAFGGSAVVAVAPVTGTPANAMAIAPNSTVTLGANGQGYIAAIAAAAGNTLYVTAGSGA